MILYDMIQNILNSIKWNYTIKTIYCRIWYDKIYITVRYKIQQYNKIKYTVLCDVQHNIGLYGKNVHYSDI